MDTVLWGGSGRLFEEEEEEEDDEFEDDELDVDTEDSADEYSDETTDNLWNKSDEGFKELVKEQKVELCIQRWNFVFKTTKNRSETSQNW